MDLYFFEHFPYCFSAKVCRQVASVDAELQHGVAEGCWIGLTDEGLEGTFRWQDNSPTNFLNWNSGEPGFVRTRTLTHSLRPGRETLHKAALPQELSVLPYWWQS